MAWNGSRWGAARLAKNSCAGLGFLERHQAPHATGHARQQNTPDTLLSARMSGVAYFLFSIFYFLAYSFSRTVYRGRISTGTTPASRSSAACISGRIFPYFASISPAFS